MENKIKTRQQKQEELVEMIYDLFFGKGGHLSDPSSKEDTLHNHTACQSLHQSVRPKKS